MANDYTNTEHDLLKAMPYNVISDTAIFVTCRVILVDILNQFNILNLVRCQTLNSTISI